MLKMYRGSSNVEKNVKYKRGGVRRKAREVKPSPKLMETHKVREEV